MQTPSKRIERNFHHQFRGESPPTVAERPADAPRLTTSNTGRWSTFNPAPYVEHTNPFDGDRLYINFNEELPQCKERNAEDPKLAREVEPYEPTEEELMESTTKGSKPLRLLNRRQQKNNSLMEHFSILSQVNEQFAGPTRQIIRRDRPKCVQRDHRVPSSDGISSMACYCSR